MALLGNFEIFESFRKEDFLENHLEDMILNSQRVEIGGGYQVSKKIKSSYRLFMMKLRGLSMNPSLTFINIEFHMNITFMTG